MSVTGKHAFFTGATSGIGKAAAMELANRGFLVIATYRDEAKAQRLLVDFKKKHSSAKGSIELLPCDLSSLESINQASSTYKEKYSKLDLLINNAGVWHDKRTKSQDGIENTFAVNLLAPVLITSKLSSMLEKASDPRIIFTASKLHQGEINFKDIELQKSKYTGTNAYRQSKLALILYSRFLAKKLENTPIEVYVNHPGLVSTELGRDSDFASKLVSKIAGKSPLKGAQTLVFLATAGKSHLTTGGYYENKKAAQTSEEAHNLDTASKLFKLSQEYLKKYLP